VPAIRIRAATVAWSLCQKCLLTIHSKPLNVSQQSESHLFCGLPPFKFACKCFYFPLTRSSPVMCVFVCVKRNRNSQISNFKLHFLFYSLFMDFLFNRKQIDFGKMKYILFWININHIIIPKYKNAQIWQAKLCFIFLQS